jgi:uncharacterized iron-regulated membrane protein
VDKPINNIVTYRDPKRSWEFMVYKDNDSAITIFGSVVYFQSVFLDPHTGKVTGARNYKYDFFNVVKYIHWSLLLLTGLILWWPKKWTKKNRDISFKIQWKASFRRVNYDLHNVPGSPTPPRDPVVHSVVPDSATIRLVNPAGDMWAPSAD